MLIFTSPNLNHCFESRGTLSLWNVFEAVQKTRTLLLVFSAVTNFRADTFTHPSSKLLQQILSTKKFNDSAVMLTMFVSRLWILSRSTPNPASSLAACLFVQPCKLPLCGIIKYHFATYRVFAADFSDFSSAVFNSLNFLLRSILNQPPSTIDKE